MTPHQPPIHPLIARLIDEFGYPQLDAGNLETWNAAPGDAVLFCAGDPVQYPECLDVAVVRRKSARLPGRFGGTPDRELEPHAGPLRLQSLAHLVFLRGAPCRRDLRQPTGPSLAINDCCRPAPAAVHRHPGQSPPHTCH